MGVFGGTFDPVHYGHLRTAFEMLQALRFGEVRFMPCGNPPHREAPVATAELRLQMVRDATVGQAGFVVDDRELQRDGPYAIRAVAPPNLPISRTSRSLHSAGSVIRWPSERRSNDSDRGRSTGRGPPS